MVTVALRAVIYARVSSKIQRDRHTIESQLRELPLLGAHLGCMIVGTYIDDGLTAKSGQLEKRDDLQRLLAAAAAPVRTFDVVLIVDVDRLSRAEDLIERYYIVGTLQRARVLLGLPGIGLVDLNTMQGEMYVTSHGAFAAQWVRQHREKISRGKREALSKGKKPAGPTPYGYGYDRHAPDGARAWSFDEAAAAIVREIFARVGAGESCRSIADDLDRRCVPRPHGGAWHRERVYQIARSRTYLGAWTASKAERITVPVPVIIDEATWAAADRQLARHNRRGVRRTKFVYMLEGDRDERVATCGICGAPIGIASAIERPGDRADVPARYVCCHRRRPPAGTEPCTLPYLRCDVVDDWLWNAITDALERPDLVEDILRRRAERGSVDGDLWQRDADAARAHLGRIERAERTALGHARAGRLSDGALTAELAALTREREAAQRQLDTALRAGAAVSEGVDQAADLETALAAIRPQLGTLDPAERRDLVRELLGPGAVTIGPRETVVLLGLGEPAEICKKEHNAIGGSGRARVGQGRRGSTSDVAPGQLHAPVVLRLLSPVKSRAS